MEDYFSVALIDFQLSGLIHHCKFFVIPRLLGNPLRDLPEKLCFSHPFLHIASSLPCDLDQTIESPDKTPLSGIRAVGQFHKEQYQRFVFPILFCPAFGSVILSELQIFLEMLDQPSFQGSMKTCLFILPFSTSESCTLSNTRLR